MTPSGSVVLTVIPSLFSFSFCRWMSDWFTRISHRSLLSCLCHACVKQTKSLWQAVDHVSQTSLAALVFVCNHCLKCRFIYPFASLLPSTQTCMRVCLGQCPSDCHQWCPSGPRTLQCLQWILTGTVWFDTTINLAVYRAGIIATGSVFFCLNCMLGWLLPDRGQPNVPDPNRRTMKSWNISL